MSIDDDVVVVGNVKKGKKRKDKSAKVDAEQEQNATPLPKVMKKRKREENGEGEGEQRKKKKKRKVTADVPSVEEPSVEEPTPTAVEEVANEQFGPGIDKRAEQRKRKELRKELKKQQKALAKGRPASSKPAPTIKNNTEEIEKYLSENAITIHGNLVPVLDFDQLDIQPPLREVLNKFSTPTPIQACAWPALLEGKDVVGIAETGSGKTLAFGLPILSRVKREEQNYKKNSIHVLIVSPTRELAIQTHDTLMEAGSPIGIHSICLYGGVPKNEQKKALKGDKNLRIVVGTPGRLLDLVNDGAVDFSNVSYMVLDEADRMLEKGFANDIQKLIGMTRPGENRQTLMFSATWPESVRQLANGYMRDPIRIVVGSDDLSANQRVEQVVDVFDDPNEKDSRLLKVLKGHQKKSIKPGSDESRTLLFVLYKAEAPRVEVLLRKQGYRVCSIHGNLGQQARLQALEDFKTGKVSIMIATDVAARGLDIPNVGLVVNYTFPLTVEDYVHRIGRTGRGGRSGKAITFFTGEGHEKALAGELMRVVREAGYENQANGLRERFSMTIKKKQHSAYGDHFREVDMTLAPKKIVF